MFVTKLEHYLIVLGIPLLRLHDVPVQFASITVTFGWQYCTTHCHDAQVMVQGVPEEPPEPVHPQNGGIFEPHMRPQRSFHGNIVMLNGSLFFWTVMKGKLIVFKESLYTINKAIEAKDIRKWPLEEIVLEQYHESLPLFNKVLADRLPPHWPAINHDVQPKAGETPMRGPCHSMSKAELVILKEWL